MKRLATRVHAMCVATTILFTAQFYHLNHKTVITIDKRAWQEQYAPICLNGLTVFVKNDFAPQKGYRYATVIIDPQCKRVPWFCHGCSRADFWPFSTCWERGDAERSNLSQ